MKTIGILAYGSLVEDPGTELGPRVQTRLSDIITPFSVEFARQSIRTRGGAPTLIPHEPGAKVSAAILVLHAEVTREEARNLLWRRETRNEGTGKRYARPSAPTPDHVLIEEIEGLGGIDTVLYTRIGPNIKDLAPDVLADLAIRSVRGTADEPGKDGISYLLVAKAQGVATPLTDEYEAAILKKTTSDNLEAALAKVQGQH